MDLKFDILVLQEGPEGGAFVRQTLSWDQIPQTVNGGDGRHICHVRLLTEALAREVAVRFALSEEQIQAMALASSLHDIGKTRIPAELLLKQEALTKLEYSRIKQHPLLGEGMICQAGKDLPPRILEYAREMARHHHERHDGSGYPDGLSENEIPISARIVSIADAYQALTAERSYKKAMSHTSALEKIAGGFCGAFDPVLVAALRRVIQRWLPEYDG